MNPIINQYKGTGVTAGFPSPAAYNIEEEIDFNHYLKPWPDDKEKYEPFAYNNLPELGNDGPNQIDLF